MAARMVADVFENDGWDSIYLGAAVPKECLLSSIRDVQPDLVALSVTMPQYLIDCEALVRAVREEFPDMPIGVGGRAFESTHDIWKQWPIDIYATDAHEFLRIANEKVGS